jgi:hypothetical protein
MQAQRGERERERYITNPFTTWHWNQMGGQRNTLATVMVVEMQFYLLIFSHAQPVYSFARVE